MKSLVAAGVVVSSFALSGALPAQIDPDPRSPKSSIDSETNDDWHKTEGDDLVLDLSAPKGVGLIELTELCSAVTGYSFDFSDREVADKTVRRVGIERVPKSKFFAFYQDILRRSDLLLLANRSSEGKGGVLSFSLRSSNGGNGHPGAMKSEAPYLRPEQIEEHRFDSARLFTTSITLTYVNAQEATNMLAAYFSDPMLESVRAITGPNTLLITGFGSSLAQFADLLKAVDTETRRSPRASVVIELSNADASEVAAILDDQFAAQARAVTNLPNLDPPVSVTASGRTNSVIVTGPTTAISFAQQLVKQLDLPIADSTETKVFPLKNAVAAETAATLSEVLESGSRAFMGKDKDGKPTVSRVEGQSSISILADARTNSLVVRAPKSRIAEVLLLIGSLDQPAGK